jgi:hypothetical protein
VQQVLSQREHYENSVALKNGGADIIFQIKRTILTDISYIFKGGIMTMFYIELPEGASDISQDENQYHIFDFEGKTYHLNQIVNHATNRQYELTTPSGEPFNIYVGRQCPNEAKTYVEYKLNTDNRPSLWVNKVKGNEKNAFNASAQQPKT